MESRSRVILRIVIALLTAADIGFEGGTVRGQTAQQLGGQADLLGKVDGEADIRIKQILTTELLAGSATVILEKRRALMNLSILTFTSCCLTMKAVNRFDLPAALSAAITGGGAFFSLWPPIGPPFCWCHRKGLCR